MSTLDTLLVIACVVLLFVAVIALDYGRRAKSDLEREAAKRERSVARLLRLRSTQRDRDRQLARSQRRSRRWKRKSYNWAFFSFVLVENRAQQQRTLEAMHQDLKAEAEANASEGEARQFHERRANRYLQLIRELRVALAREKSLREREKLVLEFLGKIAPIVKGVLPAP
jgi:hypothetical protein